MLFLIVAMLLLVTVGYVLSYLMTAEQTSVKFPIFSTQAFYIAQSGVEFAIRYSSDRGWRGTTDGGVYDLTHLNDVGVSRRNAGNGRFTIHYDGATDVLISTGEILFSTEKRTVRVSRFIDFLRLVFDPASAAPRFIQGTTTARFYIKNVRTTDIILTGFAASWTASNSRTITDFSIDGTQRYQANPGYASDSRLSPSVSFTGGNLTITPGQVVEVRISWSGNLGSNSNIVIKFFTAAGDGLTFNLDPQGDGLPSTFEGKRQGAAPLQPNDTASLTERAGQRGVAFLSRFVERTMQLKE